MRLLKTSVILGMTLLSLQSFAWVGVETSIEGFQFHRCQKDGTVCTSVMAPKADVSQIAQIYYLKNMKIEIENRKSGSKKVITSNRGYVDLASNQIVTLETVNSSKGSRTVEHIYRLEK